MKPQELARLTVETYIKTGNMLKAPESLEDTQIIKTGVFVSIKTKNDKLRGCIGTVVANEESVIQEIINNSISASTKDPRFPKITENELDNLKYSVDILHPFIIVDTPYELDPKNYGIILASATGKRAILLPDLEGIVTIEDQLEACLKKAGISENEKYSLQKFKVDRYSEN